MTFAFAANWSEIYKQNLCWEGRTYLLKETKQDLDKVITSLVMSWHGCTGEGKGLTLPLLMPFNMIRVLSAT